VAYYLRQLGIQFAIVDSRDKPPFNDKLLVDMPDISVFTGGFDAAVFALATHIIVSPGVLAYLNYHPLPYVSQQF
jgi:UDP-N-acetylmuramoylalanine--D-glutamate ligase